MAAHTAALNWDRTDDHESNLLIYSRNHTWTFDNGHSMAASSAPEFKGDPSCVDPEEALVAAIASCHMLSFLWVAVNDGFCPLHYEDNASGLLKKNKDGKLAITEVTLHPQTTWRSDAEPSAAELEELHHKAHEWCFIANSVNTEIKVAL